MHYNFALFPITGSAHPRCVLLPLEQWDCGFKSRPESACRAWERWNGARASAHRKELNILLHAYPSRHWCEAKTESRFSGAGDVGLNGNRVLPLFSCDDLFLRISPTVYINTLKPLYIPPAFTYLKPAECMFLIFVHSSVIQQPFLGPWPLLQFHNLF
jgi:hypothetical protein